MNKPEAPNNAKTISARTSYALLSNDSRDTTTHLSLCKHDEAVSASGKTALACCAEPSAAALDGSGLLRTSSGWKSTLCIANDGCTQTSASKLGISRWCILKVSICICEHVSG